MLLLRWPPRPPRTRRQLAPRARCPAPPCNRPRLRQHAALRRRLGPPQPRQAPPPTRPRQTRPLAARRRGRQRWMRDRESGTSGTRQHRCAARWLHVRICWGWAQQQVGDSRKQVETWSSLSRLPVPPRDAGPRRASACTRHWPQRSHCSAPPPCAPQERSWKIPDGHALTADGTLTRIPPAAKPAQPVPPPPPPEDEEEEQEEEKLPPGWQAVTQPGSGKVYYWNVGTGAPLVRAAAQSLQLRARTAPQPRALRRDPRAAAPARTGQTSWVKPSA